jgi:hypothetical protein
VVERYDAAGTNRGFDAGLGPTRLKRTRRAEAAHVRSERTERADDRGLDARQREEGRVVEVGTLGHSIVVREYDRRVPFRPVALEDSQRVEPAVGARRVAVQLGLEVTARDRVRNDDREGGHVGKIRGPPPPPCSEPEWTRIAVARRSTSTSPSGERREGTINFGNADVKRAVESQRTVAFRGGGKQRTAESLREYRNLMVRLTTP